MAPSTQIIKFDKQVKIQNALMRRGYVTLERSSLWPDVATNPQVEPLPRSI